tara:strand:- start:3573 stop:4058 length:486 start_codon:yes stop_codon:yes gene_type:complete
MADLGRLIKDSRAFPQNFGTIRGFWTRWGHDAAIPACRKKSFETYPAPDWPGSWSVRPKNRHILLRPRIAVENEGAFFVELEFPGRRDRSLWAGGAGRVDLIGGFTPKPCETAHDPLHARAFAFQNGNGRAVICTVDACAAPREVLDECQIRAAEAMGFQA